MAFVKAVDDSEIQAGMRIFDVEGKDLLTKLGARLACAVRLEYFIMRKPPAVSNVCHIFPFDSSRILH